jgi:hypothetical protein
LINEVVTEVNLGEFGGNTMESKMEELRKQNAEEIREYKAKILDLENQVARLTMRDAGNSSSALITSSDSSFQSLQAERDKALEEAKIAKSQALEVCMRNEVMREKWRLCKRRWWTCNNNFKLSMKWLLITKPRLADWRTKMQG